MKVYYIYIQSMITKGVQGPNILRAVLLMRYVHSSNLQYLPPKEDD